MKERNVIFLTLFILTLTPLSLAYDFCSNPVSNDELEISEIIDIDYPDKTTWPWEPTEEVEIEITVENKNFTRRDFKVELYLLREDGSNNKNFTETKVVPTKTISLDEDQSETLTFSFKIDETEDDIYYLHAKFYDPADTDICISQQAIKESEEATIQIVEEEKLIIVRSVYGPENIMPGIEAKYIVETINLGNKKEANVLVIMYNANLKIREERVILDLEISIPKNVTFNFTLPTNTTLTEEKIQFATEYDYDEEKDYYYRSSDKPKVFQINIGQQTNVTQNDTGQTSAEEEAQNQTVTTEDMQDQAVETGEIQDQAAEKRPEQKYHHLSYQS